MWIYGIVNCKLLDDLLGCPVIWIVEHHLIWIGEQHSDHLRYVQTQKEEEVKENCLNVEKFWHFVLLIVQSILFHLFFFLSILGYWPTWSTNLRDWWKPLRSGEIDPAEKLLFLILFNCIFIMVSCVSHANVSWNIILFQLFVAIYIGAI